MLQFESANKTHDTVNTITIMKNYNINVDFYFTKNDVKLVKIKDLDVIMNAKL